MGLTQELKPLTRKRKRTVATLDLSSSDSDSSSPRTKVVATSATMKISDIKSLIGDCPTEVVSLRLERELDKRSSVFMFSCFICKDIFCEESAPVVPVCCRAYVVYECMVHWLKSAILPRLQGTTRD